MKTASRRFFESGKLVERAAYAGTLLADCHLCPRKCGINRLQDENSGFCGTGRKAYIASYGAHFGEESPLVGSHGSGTIFFASCSLRCCFCQNYEISHYPNDGAETGPDEIAGVMLDLQKRGCHNINFVTPTHVVPQILAALIPAFEQGLHVPLVYNCGGYELPETLALLEGVIDIYMPDIKFWISDSGRNYCGAEDYPEIARETLKIMYCQVGDLEIDRNSLAVRGLLVRHLLMPQGREETEKILRFIATEISPTTYLNIMDQYHPHGVCRQHAELEHSIRPDEFSHALGLAKQVGLKRLDERHMATFLNRLERT